MSEIIVENDGVLFLTPQLNHLYFVEKNGTHTGRFAVYRGILAAKKTHNFFSLDDKSIIVYHCSINNCILSLDDILDEDVGLPKIMVPPFVRQLSGSKLSYSGRPLDSEYALEYPRLKKIFDQYGDPASYVRSQFSDLIKKTLNERKSGISDSKNNY